MEKRDFDLAKLSVSGMLVGTFVLVVAGVLSMFAEVVPEAAPYLKGACILGFTIIAAFALAVAQSAAACAAFLPKGERRLAYLIAVITGAVSVLGVILADGVLGNHPASMPPLWIMVPAAFALAFVKPAMANVIATCEVREGLRAEAADAVLMVKDQRIATLERELAELRKRSPVQTENASAPNDVPVSQAPPQRASQAQARGVAKALSRASANVRQRAPQAQVRRRREGAPPLSEAEVRETIAALTAENKVVNFSTVMKARGVPYSRVERSPGRHLIEACAKAA